MNASRSKVLFLIPSLSAGGAERVFSTLLQHLDRTCFELHLGVLQASGQYMRDVPADVTIHELGVSRVRYALLRIVRLIRRLKPHTILSTLGHLNIAVIATRPLMPRGTRVLIREATLVSTLLEEVTRHPGLWHWLYRSFYKRADRVVCPSDAIMKDLAENFGVPREKLVRIYNPVDVEKVRALSVSAGNPYSGVGPHLVSAGRLSLEKGMDILIQAMPAVLDCLPEARLTIVGEGPLLTDLLEQSKRLGLTEHVHFLGFQRNPWRFMRYADVFVLPSRFEGFSNALLEALALGVRVVSSDCPGAIRELRTCDARVVLTPAGDPAALAEAIILTCKSSMRSSECQEAPSTVLSQFDLHRAVDEYSKLLPG